MSTRNEPGAPRAPIRLAEVLAALPDPADDPAVRHRTMSALRTYWAAVLSKDIDGLRPLLSEDTVLEIPFSESGRVEDGYFRVFQGIDDVIAFWARAFVLEGDGPGLINAEVNITGDGRVVFVEAYGDITMANGRQYSNRYVFRLTFDDGKVSLCREYYNPIISAQAFEREIGNPADVPGAGRA